MTPRYALLLGAVVLGLIGGCAAPGPDCSAALLYRDSGYTLASPAGTTFAPTVIFSDPSGQITVTPLNHACGGYVVGSSYDLQYSFDQVQSFLWIEGWSNND